MTAPGAAGDGGRADVPAEWGGLLVDIAKRRDDDGFAQRLRRFLIEDAQVLRRLGGDMPFCVEPGWRRAEFIANVSGDSYRLLFWSDTEVGFEHRCDRGERGVIVCAPRLTNVNQPGGHQITWTMPTKNGRLAPTVRASILCPDCNTHGFITEGRWASA